jgi:hypothetical protein
MQLEDHELLGTSWGEGGFIRLATGNTAAFAHMQEWYPPALCSYILYNLLLSASNKSVDQILDYQKLASLRMTIEWLLGKLLLKASVFLAIWLKTKDYLMFCIINI